MKEPNIKKCPFCGGDAWLNRDEKTNSLFVECRNCLAKSHYARVDASYLAPTFPTYREAAMYVLTDWARINKTVLNVMSDFPKKDTIEEIVNG